MKFFYNVIISLFINLPIVWGCSYLSGLLSFPIFMPGTIFVLLMCRLNKFEGVFTAICLGLAIDAANFERELFGISCLLLSSPMILFHKKSWENVFKYRTFFWTGILNFILQFLYIIPHLLACRIHIIYIRFYIIPLLISAIIASVCGVYLLKLQNKYFSEV